jgi:hypothetical protein
VIGADDPDGAVRLEHAARSQQPGAGEGVIGLETVELVPRIVDGVDLGLVGPVQIAAELQIVGRIGEDRVDRVLRQALERGDAVALQDGVAPIGSGGGQVGDGTHGWHGDTHNTGTVYASLWLPRCVNF